MILSDEKLSVLLAGIIRNWNTLCTLIDRRKDWTDVGCGYVNMNFKMGILLEQTKFFFNKPSNTNVREFGILNGTLKVYIDNTLVDFDFDIYWAEGFPFHIRKHIEISV